MLILFHKPYQVLSQFNPNPDAPHQRTLSEYNLPSGYHPLGRLDYDSEGALLLCRDKTLERKLMHPSASHSKRYLVQIDGTLTDAHWQQIRQGALEIKVSGKTHQCAPAKGEVITPPYWLSERTPAVDPHAAQRSQWISLELTEGKNRQIRRMTAKCGCPTLRLIRERVMSYSISDLAPGEFKDIRLS